MRIAVLHPGAMGVTVGESLVRSGHTVSWLSAGRSAATQDRAVNFDRYVELTDLLATADGVVSVCPPDAAQAQAERVFSAGFRGLYLDANAISPSTAERIAADFGERYIDGGIIGPPAKQPGTTRLYLSGLRATEVADWFCDGALDARVCGTSPVAASTLKMAYAAYTKGSAALLLAVNALAAAGGVSESLEQEWEISQPALNQRSQQTARQISPKAWRFAGEMAQIAQTFEAYDLPGNFHLGAQQLYEKLAEMKNLPAQDLEAVVALLTKRR